MTPRFTLSLAHATLVDVRPPDLVRIAAKTGYAEVGLRLIPVGSAGERLHALHDDPAALQETKRALRETGIRVRDVELVRIAPGLNPQAHLPSLEVAAELGARFVIANVYEPHRAAAEDALGALCDLAKPLGLAVALEFVSFSTLRTVGETLSLLRTCGRDNAAVLIDTLHVHSSDEPLQALDAILPDKVSFIHLCDGPALVPTEPDALRRIAREARLLPGEGGIDLTGILQRLPPNALYAVEVHNPDRAASLGAEAYARLAFETATGYLAAHAR